MIPEFGAEISGCLQKKTIYHQRDRLDGGQFFVFLAYWASVEICRTFGLLSARHEFDNAFSDMACLSET